jgi:hypothetical protein
MDDTEYVASLLAILTNPDPPGVDPADPYRQSTDGIDRYDGFGTEVRVESITRVEGRYGEELEIAYALAVPPAETRVPARATVRVPFDAEWRRLSEYDDPAAYAPTVAQHVGHAAYEHVVLHRHRGGRAAVPPDREESWRQLVAQLAQEGGHVTEIAVGRAEVRLRGRVVTVAIEPGESFAVAEDEFGESPLVASMDDDEHFLVAWAGGLHGSTRAELPPVRGRARWRRARERRVRGGAWRAHRPPAPG